MRYVHACYSCLQRANSAQIPFWKQRSECATSKWNAGQAYSPSYVASGRVLCDQFHDQERRGSTMIETIILVYVQVLAQRAVFTAFLQLEFVVREVVIVGWRTQGSFLRRVGVKGSCKGSPKK